LRHAEDAAVAKKRRPTTKPSAKRKRRPPVKGIDTSERLKPISLAPLDFDQALDALMTIKSTKAQV
jgi:hypothetical protein